MMIGSLLKQFPEKKYYQQLILLLFKIKKYSKRKRQFLKEGYLFS